VPAYKRVLLKLSGESLASGAAFALDGEIQQVSPGILLITPSNVDVTSDLRDELTSRGFFSWTAK
jgi:cell division inhibitor SepF